MFKLIKLLPSQTNFHIMKHNTIFVGLATILMVLSLALIIVKPFNYGIDFSGGILMEIKTPTTANIEEIRKSLHKFSPEIQSEGDTGDLVTIRLPQGNKDEAQITQMLGEVKQILGDKIEYRNTQIVGPKVGSDLVKSGIIAVILSIIIMGLYIWIRFELPFAIGASISLTHDIILALGMMVFTHLEFNLTSLAALLTLVGYSINDTVVIYDRIRDNIKRYKNKNLADIIDLSINQTHSRTILTSVTTFLAVLSIFIFGGEVLHAFSSIMLFGIVVGTYSSTFLSTSTLLLFGKDRIK